MNLSKHITKIDFNSKNDKFTISTNEEQLDEAEGVIVTVPVPQVLTQLKGSIAQLIGTYKTPIKN
jgi:protoporphyrinogen oxidase